MRSNFDLAFSLVILFEGGDKVTRDPNDPGGLTKYGISKRANPDLDIENLTFEQAKAIYLERYWEPAECDPMNTPMDILAFDTAVNMGLTAARELIAESNQDPYRFCLCRIRKYLERCKKNPGLNIYFKGWISRVIQIYTRLL